MCSHILKFLNENPQNVCVITCNDGRSVSAVAACTLLLYCKAIDNVDLCLSFFENKRGDQLNLTTNQYKYLSDTHRLLLASRGEIMPPLPLTPNECILLSIALVVATQAKGTVLFHQKMFESRLFFTDKLIDMGAQIVLCDPHRAVVVGLDKQSPLKGNTMSSPDIRAGLALLIAALSAQGKSIIQNGEQIDRGYERIDERLRALGAEIKRL